MKTILFAMILSLSGCCTVAKHQIIVENVKDIMAPVLDRHDAYVSLDSSLNNVMKAIALGQSEKIRVAIKGINCVHVDVIGKLVEDIAKRHDAYVEGDNRTSPVEKRIALRSTALLRATIEEARK